MNRVNALSLLVPAFLAVSPPTSLAMPQPGSNADPDPGPAGNPPYEMSGRHEARTPIAHFADCTVWTVEMENAEANLYRTREQRLFREYCGKLVYRATGARPTITVRPQEAIPIPEPWDCLNAWNWGNVWAWARRKDTPPLQVEALILDSAGTRTPCHVEVRAKDGVSEPMAPSRIGNAWARRRRYTEGRLSKSTRGTW